MALICVTSNQMALICVTSNQKVNLSEINTWKWLVRILMSSLSLFGDCQFVLEPRSSLIG